MDDLTQMLNNYKNKVQSGIAGAMRECSIDAEQYAKENAPWRDKTGAARAGLHSFIIQESDTKITLIIAHGVDYGAELEFADGGTRGVIDKTLIAAKYSVITKLKTVLKGK